MRLLLDTHTLIWAIAGSAKLSHKARRAIEDPKNDIYVSAVSAWEIAIKKAMGRLSVPDDLVEAVEEVGFITLGLSFETALRVEQLPRHHGDPFDRMLIVQASAEQMLLVTNDHQIAAYNIPLFW